MRMGESITVTIRLGFLKENITAERSMLDAVFVQDRARQFLGRHFPNQTIPPHDQILLFRHNDSSANLLQLLQSDDPLVHGTVLEIIVLSSANGCCGGGGQKNGCSYPHVVSVQSYFSPTFCDFCGELLVGLSKQGLRCAKCAKNFHKKCAFVSHNSCALATQNCVSGIQLLNNGGVAPPLKEQTATVTKQESLKQTYNGLPHTFGVHSYTKPTVCKYCKNLLVGIIKQGLQCSDCKVNVHKRCAMHLPMDCKSLDVVCDENTWPLIINNGCGKQCGRLNSVQVITKAQESIAKNNSNSINNKESIVETNDEDKSGTGGAEQLIPLGRIPGAATANHANARNGTGSDTGTTLMEGWMLHFTSQNATRKRHFWRMNQSRIAMFFDESAQRCYKTISFADILGFRLYDGPPLDDAGPPHCIEIQTASVIFYAGENLDWYKTHRFVAFQQLLRSSCNSAAQRECGVGLAQAQKWDQCIRAALMPNIGQKATNATAVHPDNKSDNATVKFGELFQIYADKELGTGMFGTVYSGVHRQSKRAVAIKVITKDRANMNKKWKDTLRNEIAILQKLNHPGIITLEAVFEFPDKIYLVMEKMEADMLEMILSNRNGRLPERIARFLVVQILHSLKYLHSQELAHCDLKPENVLLSCAESDFPQAKVCDFGYARMIEENTFRKTVVGTPAYMAPELLQKKPYNKSLDLWSLGVVIYVTLSGTFPFNEGEAIEDQIQNAAFMFPQNLWNGISTQAIDLISRLLKVKMEERLTIEECFQQPWLQHPQLYTDLRELEERIGTRYLTTIEDDRKW